MGERIVGPAVYTNEKDLSYLQQGLTQIGGAFIGPTTKGPAFVPTVVHSYNEFVQKFGDTDVNLYVPYTVKQYLKNSGTATIVRVLHAGGYKCTNPVGLYVSGTFGKVFAGLLHPTQKSTLATDDTFYDGTNPLFQKTTITNTATTGTFVINVSGSGNASGTVYSASSLISSPKFLTNVFSNKPTTTSDPAYLYQSFKNIISASFVTDANTKMYISTGSTNDFDFTSTQGYSNASTPWITSQPINGTTTNNLFQFITLSDGNSTNYEVKVAISNIKAAGSVPGSLYGSFSVTVRAVDQTNIVGSPYTTSDSDVRPNVLEQFDNLNLDPMSANYIVRRIGDRYKVTDSNGKVIIYGDYNNNSKYVRVSVDANVTNQVYSPALVPFGFRSLYVTIPSPLWSGITYPTASYITDQKVSGTYNRRKHWGFNFDFSGTDNLNYLSPLPTQSTSLSTGSNADFNLSNYSQDSATGLGTGSLDLTSNTSIDSLKFIVPFQGGFDGTRPNKPKYTGTNIVAGNSQGFDLSTVTAAGYIAYKKAIDAISNSDEYDINMVTLPGTIYSLHPGIINYASDMALNRGDTFMVFDCAGLTDSISTAISTMSGYDNNYAATYYPWVKILDVNVNRPVWVPTSVVLPGVIAFNDKVAAEWYAPAGLNRGGLTEVLDAYSRLTGEERGQLYDARINPIATFPGQGVSVWGQKTMQAKPSALDRINVRRLLIALKKYIASATKYLVFEQNTSTTRNRFLNIVNPYMESVQQRQGLYTFKVVMDESNNTPDIIDRSIMYGQIFLQPAKTAEVIILDFNIMPTGASFGQ